ncbi:MAG: di-trans,poly-cis-decaprenylcistransferase [Candidatus Puniceispirillum sp.]|nr:di-trans,poly-cis-decaprenylcistransferase [Candidatus Pelagibacter sp.]MBA4282777.1 di-trans,poly-cis-decaprenylcistransferase [Candidatus Puniceispirillum sp.]
MTSVGTIHNQRIPKHVAIVMDGNRRWAKQHKQSEIQGHKAGVSSLRNSVSFAIKNKIEVLSVYAFSKENWGRGPKWLKEFFNLFISVLDNEIKELHHNNVKITFIGDQNELSKELQHKINECEQLTKNNNLLHLVIAFNYSGRNEIIRAIQKIIESKVDPRTLNEDIFGQYLDTKGIPEPDLFIRTSGEYRISNFLLWQMSYSEFVFINTLWPDFSEDDFRYALEEYSKRDRRYGRTST